jgi:UDP-2,3-diacylglucosamine pyrophosphatase LpxH
MQTLIIADAHVGTRTGDAEAMATVIGRAVDAGAQRIISLGDAFQYLIGMSKFWTSSVTTVLNAWDAARRSGVAVELMEGNRDFFLDEPDLRRHHDGAHRMLDLTVGPRRFRLVHGDKVNQRDFQYLFWSRFSKSWPARLWARLLPRRLAVYIVTSMEARLADTNRKFRYDLPEKALRSFADRAFADGVDTVLWGHFHRLWRYRAGDHLAMVVPAWLETRVALSIDGDGAWALIDEELRPVALDGIRHE